MCEGGGVEEGAGGDASRGVGVVGPAVHDSAVLQVVRTGIFLFLVK